MTGDLGKGYGSLINCFVQLLNHMPWDAREEEGRLGNGPQEMVLCAYHGLAVPGGPAAPRAGGLLPRLSLSGRGLLHQQCLRRRGQH